MPVTSASFLFGDVLGVSSDDLTFHVVRRRRWWSLPWWSATGRSWLCRSTPTRPGRSACDPRMAHAVMLGLIAVAIVSSFQAVGALLVFGLLVAPPATASLLVRRVPLVMVVGVAIGVVSVVAGLLISYHHDTAASATMAFTAVALFFVVLAGRELAVSPAGSAQRVLGDDGEHVGPVAFRLHRPDAGEPDQVAGRAGLGLGDGHQGGVVEDHVGGHVGGAGLGGPPGPQCFEHLGVSAGSSSVGVPLRLFETGAVARTDWPPAWPARP
jgi:hypothetical protein